MHTGGIAFYSALALHRVEYFVKIRSFHLHHSPYGASTALTSILQVTRQRLTCPRSHSWQGLSWHSNPLCSTKTS